jgi:hypothetical protein
VAQLFGLGRDSFVEKRTETPCSSRSLTGNSRLVLGHVLWPCDVTCSEHGRDHSLLLGGDSFVNGACQDLPGDGPQAWTMAIAGGELPLGAGAMRFATNCAKAYARASAPTRRRFNQAVFTRIDVRDGRSPTSGTTRLRFALFFERV